MRRAMLLGPLAVLGGLMLFGCDKEVNRAGQEGPAAPGAAPGTAPGANVDVIKETPERYYGKTVRLVGSVARIDNDRSFELEGADWAFNDNITVLTKTPVNIGGAGLLQGEEIVVVGKVRPFVVAEVERDLGWDIGSDVEMRLSRRPVIVAESIRRVGDPGRWPGGGTDAVATSIVIVAQADPGMLAGRKVDLARERVQAVTGKGLWVGSSPMAQVFVLPAQLPKDVQVGDRVHVTGTLQKTPKDAAKSWELPAGTEGMATDRMVFVDGATVIEVDERPDGRVVR